MTLPIPQPSSDPTVSSTVQPRYGLVLCNAGGFSALSCDRLISRRPAHRTGQHVLLQKDTQEEAASQPTQVNRSRNSRNEPLRTCGLERVEYLGYQVEHTIGSEPRTRGAVQGPPQELCSPWPQGSVITSRAALIDAAMLPKGPSPASQCPAPQMCSGTREKPGKVHILLAQLRSVSLQP